MEYWDVYDRTGRLTGRTVPKGTKLGPEEYQLAVEAWFVTEQKFVLIQQRSEGCENSPGMWSVTAGRVQAGESSLEGCLREIREELGLELASQAPERIRRIVRTDGSQHLWDVYRIRCGAFD
ncbi:MAG TPA: NUDIX domain-containing protein, partial [Clostridia bacterium]|nr:NUDIX domain-containing protein [Clostridia bacterium]